MIIYGTRAKLIKAEYIAENCPNCGSSKSLQLSVWQRWGHIFWIPCAPIGKTGVSACGKCQQVLQLKNMPQSLQIAYDNLKSDTKTPFWTFTGVGVIATIVLFTIISSQLTQKKVTGMLGSLKQNDVIHFKLADTLYALAKVNRVKGDTVFIRQSNWQAYYETDINGLKEKGYAEKEDTATVADLKMLDSKGQIIDIER